MTINVEGGGFTMSPSIYLSMRGNWAVETMRISPQVLDSSRTGKITTHTVYGLYRKPRTALSDLYMSTPLILLKPSTAVY